MKKGDIIEVLKVDTEWWFGVLPDGSEGITILAKRFAKIRTRQFGANAHRQYPFGFALLTIQDISQETMSQRLATGRS